MLSEIDLPRVSAGTVTYPPGGTLGPRRQADVQLVLVHSGSARVWIDDGREPRTVAAGEAGLLLPGHRERFAFDRYAPTRHSWIQLHAPDAPLDRLAGLPAVLALSPALEAIAAEAVAAAAPPLRAHLAAAALWRYVGEAERDAPERSRPVDDAQRFIHAHLHDPALALGDVARAVHVTVPHLIRSFRAEHGTTPGAYLWQRRVALGLDLLAHTGLPLATVAERCGFKTAHHFSRRVKHATGLPPAAYRRARWDATVT